MTAGSGDGARSGAERMRALRQRRAAERRAQAGEVAKLARRQAHEQLPLMPVAPAGDDERRAGGRPAGKVGAASQQLRQLLFSKYRMPAVVLAEIYSRPVDELARDLSCSKLDAFRVQVAAASDLMPYVHSKMPLAVQTDSVPQVGITLAVSAETAAAMGAAMPPVPLPRTVVNQALSEDDAA